MMDGSIQPPIQAAADVMAANPIGAPIAGHPNGQQRHCPEQYPVRQKPNSGGGKLSMSNPATKLLSGANRTGCRRSYQEP